MSPSATTAMFLLYEAAALLGRLDWVRPFSLTMPAVGAAAVTRPALLAMEYHLIRERRLLRSRTNDLAQWLNSPPGRAARPDSQQRKLTMLRLQFNTILDQFDIFADVLSQRGEHEAGVWLAGLDAVAADALSLPGAYFEAPPMVTYLDRGHGAAIRRARTRLPGGSQNPVAIIRVPRERMLGSCGIGASLAHEVGHQGSALLDLVRSIQPVLRDRAQEGGTLAPAWHMWERWISEIWCDYWALAKLGVCATLGLIAAVSLPRAFVFRINLDDPHPFPWIRVKLSCALGRILYPDPQWDRLARLWDSLYPTTGLSPMKQKTIAPLEATLPAFTKTLVEHRPPALRGKSLREVMPIGERQPGRLRVAYRKWQGATERVGVPPPTLAFAVLGQACADQTIDTEHEGAILTHLLQCWPLRNVLGRKASVRI